MRPWPPELIQKLLGLMAEGYTGTQAAQELGHGLTRCAVIGKFYRIKQAAKAAEQPEPRRSIRTVINRGGRTMRNPKALAPKPQRAPKPPKLKLIQSEPLPLPEPPTGGILFSERFGNQCSYIYGDPLAADAKCCGQRVKENARVSFCDRHHAICTVPEKKQKRRRAA